MEVRNWLLLTLLTNPGNQNRHTGTDSLPHYLLTTAAVWDRAASKDPAEANTASLRGWIAAEQTRCILEMVVCSTKP